MSIIFDALQKSERRLKKGQIADVYPRRVVLRLFVEVVLLLVLSILWVLPFPPIVSQAFLSAKATPVVIKTPTVLQNTAPVPKAVPHTVTDHFVLNGIFFSGKVKVAMINNRLLAEGDQIGSMRIVHIGKSDVDLSDGVKTFKLRSLM